MARPLTSRAPAPPGAPGGPGLPEGALPSAPLGGTRAEALRRLQMGALGVVAVLLLIGLASIIKDRATESESTAVAGAAPTTAPTTAVPAADPLAEAGVVPDIPASPTAAGGTPSPAAPAPAGPRPDAR